MTVLGKKGNFLRVKGKQNLFAPNFNRGTLTNSSFENAQFILENEILQVEQKIMSPTVKGWLWNDDSEAAYFNTAVKEHRLERTFLWNSTIFGTRSLSLPVLLFCLCLQEVVHLEITDIWKYN